MKQLELFANSVPQGGGPRFAVWENVPGAFSSNNGEDFACVVQEMADLGAHDVAWRVLDSRFFRVAQRRRRVFLVADFGGERAAEILSLTEGVRGDSAPRSKARKGAPADAGAGAEGGLRCDGTGGGISGTVSCKWAKGTGGPAGAEFYNLVATETVGTLCSDSHPGAYSGQDAYTGRLVPMAAKDETVACYDYLGTQGGGVEVGVSPTLKRKDGVAVTVPVKAKDTGSHWDDPSNPHPCLNQSNGGAGGVGASNQEIFSQRGAYWVPGVPLPFDTTQITSPHNRSQPKAGDPCHTLQSAAHPPAVAMPLSMRESGHGYWIEDTVSGTLDSSMGHSGHGNRAATIAFNIYPGQPTDGRPAELHAKQTDVANAVTVTEYARSTDRGTRVVCATGEVTHTLDRAHGATEDGTGRGIPVVCATGEVTHALRAEGADASEDGTGHGTPIVPVAFSPLQGGRSMPVTHESPTLEAGNGNKTPAVLQPKMACRRLMPVETCRLQAFPDDWNAEGIDKQGRRIVMADSSRYKQMGNAVTVSVAHALAVRIRAVLESGE